MKERIKKIAQDTFKQIALWGFSRVDFKLHEHKIVSIIESACVKATKGLRKQYDEVHAIAVEKDRLWSESCNKLRASQPKGEPWTEQTVEQIWKQSCPKSAIMPLPHFFQAVADAHNATCEDRKAGIDINHPGFAPMPSRSKVR